MKFIFLSLVFFAQNILAEPAEVVLSQLDTYLGQKTFSESFVLGDNTEIRHYEKLGGTRIQSERVNFNEINRVDANSVTLATRSKEGRVITTREITSSEWAGLHSNYARAVVKLMQMAFEVELFIKDFTEYRMILNNRPARISGLKIEYIGKNRIGNQIQGEMIVTNQLPGMAQVAYRKEKQGNLENTWSVLSFSRPTH